MKQLHTIFIKKILLLLLSNACLLAMHNQERQFSLEGHDIVVRHCPKEQFLFAQFAHENAVRNTYVSKNLRTNKFFPRTKYVYYSQTECRDIYLADELDRKQADLLTAAINQYEKDMEID